MVIMFTGIIEELGIVKNIERRSNLMHLGIAVSFTSNVKIGDSISVNGVCLTAAKIENNILYFDLMQETLKTTNSAELRLNDKVNLEQALKAGDRLSGHIVTGHIDTTGIIRFVSGQSVIEISISDKFMSGIVNKGSVAVDGVSLTVAEKKKDSFIVSIIPHTLKATTLGLKKPGDIVNIELDVMGKYSSQAAQNASIPAKNRITEDFLRQHGF